MHRPALALDRAPCGVYQTTFWLGQPALALDQGPSGVDRTTHWADRPSFGLGSGPCWGESDMSLGGSASFSSGLGSGPFWCGSDNYLGGPASFVWPWIGALLVRIRQLPRWISQLWQWIESCLGWIGQLTGRIGQLWPWIGALSGVDRTTPRVDRPALALDRAPLWCGSDNSVGGSASFGLGSGPF